MRALPKQSGEYLLENILRRHENRFIIMTSNRPIEDWGKLLGDVPTAGAIRDHFLQRAQVITISGRSYRLKDKASPAPDKKEKKDKTEPGSTAGGAS